VLNLASASDHASRNRCWPTDRRAAVGGSTAAAPRDACRSMDTSRSSASRASATPTCGRPILGRSRLRLVWGH
jgi:hypothetical protein